MHGRVKDVVVTCLDSLSSSSKQDLEQSNRGPVLEKGWSSIMSYAYEFILHVILAYIPKPAIHIDYQIT